MTDHEFKPTWWSQSIAVGLGILTGTGLAIVGYGLADSLGWVQ